MKIALSRKELYERWFKNFDEKKIEETIYSQGENMLRWEKLLKKNLKILWTMVQIIAEWEYVINSLLIFQLSILKTNINLNIF